MRHLFVYLGIASLVLMAWCTASQLGLWAILPILLYPLGLCLELSNPANRKELIDTFNEFEESLLKLKEIF